MTTSPKPAGLLERVLFGPFAGPLAARLANRTALRPLALTLAAAALAGLAALLFWLGPGAPWVIAALLFPASALCARLAGALARLAPDRDTPNALIAAHMLEPWRTLVPVFALVGAEYAATGSISVLGWAVAFVFGFYLDWALARMMVKARGAYASLYRPDFGPGDRGLLKAARVMSRAGLKLICLGAHEKGLLVLTVAPLIGAVAPMLIAVSLLSFVLFGLRLWLDTALLKDELITGLSGAADDAAQASGSRARA